MYTLKQHPEDFIVEEISSVPSTTPGPYSYFLLKKRNYSFFRTLQNLADYWHAPMHAFGYAGIKDKFAVTTQLCSVKDVSQTQIESTQLKDITVTYVGSGDKPMYLGGLTGNKFTVVVRSLDTAPQFKTAFVNYYGEQRFSKSNVDIGRFLIKKKYKEAIALLETTQHEQLEPVLEHLTAHPNDYINAFRLLSPQFFSIFVHAYQSSFWNRAVFLYLKEHPNPDFELTFPVYGFGTEFKNEEIERLYTTLLQEEGVTERDFVNTSIKSLCSYGTERPLWVEVVDLMVKDVACGVQVQFSLPKGAYATEYLRQSLQNTQDPL